jgi:hypothetical protein
MTPEGRARVLIVAADAIEAANPSMLPLAQKARVVAEDLQIAMIELHRERKLRVRLQEQRDLMQKKFLERSAEVERLKRDRR